MRNVNNSQKAPQSAEVYYFQNGLHIELPYPQQDRSVRQDKENRNKEMAENLLKEYTLKKQHDPNRLKTYKNPNEIIKENIVCRTERFLNERQVDFCFCSLKGF